MKITIEINTDNDAFQDRKGWEVRRILNEIVKGLDYDFMAVNLSNKPLRDINGNVCGHIKIVEE